MPTKNITEIATNDSPNKKGVVAMSLREPLGTIVLQELADAGLTVFIDRAVPLIGKYGGYVVARRDEGVLTNAQLGMLERLGDSFDWGYYSVMPRLRGREVA